MRKREHIIKFRLTEKEMLDLKKSIKKTGLSTEAYFRMLIKNKVPKPLPPVEYFAMIEELRRIAVSLEDVRSYAIIFNDENKQKYDENYKNVIDFILRIEKAILSPTAFNENGGN